MKVLEIQELLDLELAAGKNGLDRNVTGGYCGDLLSDVIANSMEGSVWIGVQRHKNIVAVAVLKELSAIILVNGQNPDEDTRIKADEEDLPILVSQLSAYELAGRLFEAGIGKEAG